LNADQTLHGLQVGAQGLVGPGYRWILTATSRPSDHTARCTWLMLAEATGLSSKD
jgi:hypothetical protein